MMRATLIFISVCLVSLASPSPENTAALTSEDILAYEDWQELHDQYTVKPEMLEILRSKIPPNLRIEVFFAYWCGDSRDNIPGFIKMISLLEKPAIAVHYHEVSRKSSPDVQFYDEPSGVERIPTFIFYAGSKELGRIIEQPERDLAEDTLRILF